MDPKDRRLYLLLVCILVAIATVGMIAPGTEDASIGATLSAIARLQIRPARLVNDFTRAESPGAALVNAALVAGIGLVLVRLNGVRLAGPTVAAVFTLFGFGLFGKTPLNFVPIIIGVSIAARIAGKQFKEYILIAMFGSALGPLVSLIAFEIGLPPALSVPVGLLGGVAVGVVLPAIAFVMLRLHQGYSLYNIGLTTGFLALFAAAIVFGRGGQLPGGAVWNSEPTLLLILLVPAVSLALIGAGLLQNAQAALRGFVSITSIPGRLPSDFMDMVSVPAALVNMGVMGLLMWGYVIVVGADLNGPVLGGIFTIVGFAAFGKQPRNVLPVIVGVAAAALLFGHELSAPGVILAALFGTTLAPLAGEFGFAIGAVAGFLHLLIVLRSGAWHAGIGLYNNGLAGGLTATLLVATIEWYRANRQERRAARAGSYAASADGADDEE